MVRAILPSMTDTAAPVDVDLDLLRAIRDVRAEKGACTVRNLATKLGLTSSGVQHRLARAEAVGHVEKSDVAGSLRVTEAAGLPWRVQGLVRTEAGDHQITVVVTITDEGEPLDVRLV